MNFLVTTVGRERNESRDSATAQLPVMQPPPTALKDLVKRYRVCWEAWPEHVFVGAEKRQIGFSLDLCGTHEPGTGHVDPGCAHCRQVVTALKEIADWILPGEDRPSAYEIDADQSLTYAPPRGYRPDVTVTIRIQHRGVFDHPVDDCEIRCLKEMEQRLQELGACKLHWTVSEEEVSQH